MQELKIGFIGVNSNLLNGKQNIKVFENSIKLLTEIVKPHQLVYFKDVLVDTSEGQEKLTNLIEEWDEIKFDLIIIQSVGFGLGAGPVDIAMSQKDVPIVLWALPEPDLKEGNGLQRNSWCGVNMHSAHLSKLGVRYEYIYGLPGQEVELKLKKIIKIFEVIKKLRKSTIGAIGARVPGYYDSNFDELSLRKSLGIKFEFFDMAQIFSIFDKISDKEVEDTAKKIYSFKKVNIDNYIKNSTKFYISIKKIITDYDLSAVSVKCWPDLQNILNIAACSVVSALGDLNIPVSCEGDMLGAASMLLMHYFSGDVTSLVDIADFDFKENNFLIFHCGACPTTMASERDRIEHREQSIAATHPGIANEFGLKSGSCAILRLREDNNVRGKYKMFFADGEGIEDANIIRGNTLKIKIKSNLSNFIDTIIKNGFEHHYAFGYGVDRNLLIKFCEWADIETYFV